MYELLLIFSLSPDLSIIWDLGVFDIYDHCMKMLVDMAEQWPWIQDNFWCVLVENI